jgi:hypothetical protein
MNHRRIERISTDLSIVLLVAVCLLSTVALADAFLDWDLLEGLVEEIASFLIAALLVQLAGACLLSVVLSLQRIAGALESRQPAAGDPSPR